MSSEQVAPRKTGVELQSPLVVLVVLLLVYMVSYIDRTALGVLQEPIKRELGLSDWQLGLLSGPAFALLYTIAGVPIARLAERHSRSAIIATAVFFWSLMTMACGVAQSYWQILLFRVGVGIGEAGSNPASHSLIADLYPPERRARAVAIYSLGVPVGAFLGSAIAGWAAQIWGWREAFFILGPIGFVLALSALALIPNVKRGRFDAPIAQSQHPSLGDVLRRLLSRSEFWHLAIASSIVVLVGWGTAAFLPSFLIRGRGLNVGDVGLIAGLVNGAAAGIGILLGGFVSDRLGRKNIRAYSGLPAITVLVAGPMFVLGFYVTNLTLATSLLMLATVSLYAYLAPSFARVHNMVEARMRATAASIFLLIINLIGMGIGPPLIGAISDYMAIRSLAQSAPGANFAVACDPAGPQAAFADACRTASSEGVTYALMIVSVTLLWAAVHFFLASRAAGREAGQ